MEQNDLTDVIRDEKPAEPVKETAKDTSEGVVAKFLKGSVKIFGFAVKKTILIAVAAALLVLICVIAIGSGKKGSTVTDDISVQFNAILEKSDIIVAEYIHDGIASWTENDDGKDEEVAKIHYSAKVRFSFDLEKVECKFDGEGKTVTLTVPEPKVEDPTINDKKEILYADKSSKKSYSDASGAGLTKIENVCKKDVTDYITNGVDFKNFVEESAKNTITAMTSPLVPDGYELVVNFN